MNTAPCPLCDAATKSHCAPRVCAWLRCTNAACRAVIDLAGRRGIRNDERVTW